MLFPLLAAPTVMLIAGAVERRHGSALAGWLGAAPISIALVLLGVGEAAPEVASTAASRVAAQAALAVAFAAVMARRGPPAGLLAGIAAFAGGSLLLTAVPTALATAAAFPALLAGPRLLRAADVAGPRGPSWTTTAAGAAVAFALVGSALTAARVLGPVAGGTVAAFPAVSTALALVVARSRGPRPAAQALGGMILGLRGYLAFCLTMAAAAPALGVPGAVALGLAACGLTYALLRNSAPCAAPSSRSTYSPPRPTPGTPLRSCSTARD